MKTATISSSGSPSPSSSSVSSSSSSSSSSSPSHLHQRCAVRAEDRTGKQRLENGEDQMQACFVRLMQIVPTIPPTTGKMSKVQLLQHVIDYILDLEYTLDLRPTTTTTTTTGTEGKAQGAEGKARDGGGASEASASPPPQPPMTAWSAAPQLMTAPVDRRPLTENAQTNNGGRHQARYLSTFGATTITDTVNGMMKAIMMNELSCQFNWAGNRGKHSFQALGLSPSICDAVRINEQTRDTVNRLAEDKIKVWLRQARDRDGGRKRFLTAAAKQSSDKRRFEQLPSDQESDNSVKSDN